MIRKTFTITENNKLELEQEAENIGIPAAELLRRIIDEHFKNKKENQNAQST